MRRLLPQPRLGATHGVVITKTCTSEGCCGRRTAEIGRRLVSAAILHAARTANTRVAGVLSLRRRWLWSRCAAVWNLGRGLGYCGGYRKLSISPCSATQRNGWPAGGHRLATNRRRGIARLLFVRVHRRAVRSRVMAGRDRRRCRCRIDASPLAPVVAAPECERQGTDSGQKSDKAAQSHKWSLMKRDEKRSLNRAARDAQMEASV